MLVPIPPLAEQRRIVAKVDELMALCDLLEESLCAGDDVRSRLLDALVADALQRNVGAGHEDQPSLEKTVVPNHERAHSRARA
jgi:hypothetical protein